MNDFLIFLKKLNEQLKNMTIDGKIFEHLGQFCLVLVKTN